MSQERGPDIHLYIDRLVLDGLPVNRSQAPQIQKAVQAELRRLLGEDGIAAGMQAGGALPSLSANGIQLTAASNPAQIGAQIAQSIYSGIGTKP